MGRLKKKIFEILNIKLDPAFGMDISDKSIEILEFSKFLSFKVTAYGRAELDRGIVEDGKIVDIEILAEKIRVLLANMKPKRVSTNRVVLSLPESKVFIHNFNLPLEMKDGELRQTILSKASELIPREINEIYWDFQSYSSLEKAEQSVVFVGIEKDVAEDYIRLCNIIGLEIVSLEVESMSLGRVLLGRTEENTLVVDIGAKSTNILVFNNKDVINLSVTDHIAGDSFTEIISKVLSIDFQEAEREKIAEGLREESSNRVAPILRKKFDEIISEMIEIITYYEGKTGQKIEKIILVGGSSLLPGINEYFSSKINIPIENRDLLSHISRENLLEQGKNSVLFANVMGLAMIGASNEFHSINLLKQIPKQFFVASSKIDLVKDGYLRKTTKFALLMNSYIVLVLLLIIIVITIFVFAYYFNQYFNPYFNKYINFISNLFLKNV
ncbi:MAG: type IV pilus assembly protein PilM [Minisyncoccia bacterium]